MWDYNPSLVTPATVDPTKAGQGRYYAGGAGHHHSRPRRLRGHAQWMKNYVGRMPTRFYDGHHAFLTARRASVIPPKPTITYVGAAGYPADSLRFQHVGLHQPEPARPSRAMEWRIARDDRHRAAGLRPDAAAEYEINAQWDSGPITAFSNTVAIPGAGLEAGGTTGCGCG